MVVGVSRLLLGNKIASEVYNDYADSPQKVISQFKETMGRYAFLQDAVAIPTKVAYVINCSNARMGSENLTRYEFLNIVEGTSDPNYPDNYKETCTPEKFEEYAKTIDEMLGEAIEQDSAVLVCCQGGNHRSASVVVYWVATRFGLTFEKAHEEVRKLKYIKEYGDEYAEFAGKGRATAMSFAQKAVGSWYKQKASSHQPG